MQHHNLFPSARSKGLEKYRGLDGSNEQVIVSISLLECSDENPEILINVVHSIFRVMYYRRSVSAHTYERIE